MGVRANNGQIRVMTSEDVASVMAIESRDAGSSWTQAKFNASLDAGHVAWVMVDKERLLGYIVAQVVCGVCEILTIGVDSSVRRRGIALALMQNALKGSVESILEVRCGNHAAISLYHRLGFKQVGVRKQYYSNPVEDAIVMKCIL